MCIRDSHWSVVDSLQTLQTNYEAVDKLLDILLRRDDEDLTKFYKCLDDSNQGHIVKLIVGDTEQHSENIPPGKSNSLNMVQRQ